MAPDARDEVVFALGQGTTTTSVVDIISYAMRRNALGTSVESTYVKVIERFLAFHLGLFDAIQFILLGGFGFDDTLQAFSLDTA